MGIKYVDPYCVKTRTCIIVVDFKNIALGMTFFRCLACRFKLAL